MSAGRTPWAAVAAIVLAGIVAALQVGKAAIALPILRVELDLSLQAAGWIMSIFAVLGMLAGIPAGAAANRFGDRRILLLGLGAIALGSTGGALAASFAALLVARLIEGMGFLFIAVSATAVLQHITAPRDRDVAFSVWSTYMPAGMAIALLVGAVLTGWRGFWLANAVIAVATMVLVAVVVPPRAAPAVAPGLRDVAIDAGRTIAAGGPVLLALAFSTYALQWFAMFSFLPILLMERMGLSVSMAGVMTAVSVGANVLGNLGAGFLLARGVPRPMLIAGASLVMGVSAIEVFAAGTPDLLVFLLCVVFSAVGGLLPGTVFASVPLLVPKPHLVPIAVGLIIHGNNLGQLIGPVAIGGMVDLYGWPAASIPVAAGAMVSVIAGLMLAPVLRARASTG